MPYILTESFEIDVRFDSARTVTDTVSEKDVLIGIG